MTKIAFQNPERTLVSCVKLRYKVQILKKFSHLFLMLLNNVKKKIQIFVAFAEYFNFKYVY